jgi:hypothetical protein
MHLWLLSRGVLLRLLRVLLLDAGALSSDVISLRWIRVHTFRSLIGLVIRAVVYLFLLMCKCLSDYLLLVNLAIIDYILFGEASFSNFLSLLHRDGSTV